MKVTKRLVDHMVEKGLTHAVVRPGPDTYAIWARHAAKALLSGVLQLDEYAELAEGPALAELEDEHVFEEGNNPMSISAKKMFGNGGEEGTSGRVRVKSPSEGLCDKRVRGLHSKTGKPVMDAYGEEASLPSEKSLAMSGVYLKMSAKKAGIDVAVSEWEKSLWHEMVEQEQWASYNGEPTNNEVFSGSRVKALLDDASSGGLEIAPISFDSDIVSNVLLSGELMPFVDRKPVSRGRRIEGASVGHPTISWGNAEGTEGSLQDFTSYVSAINTTIYPAVCFCEVGRDMLSDSGVDVGQMLVDRISEAFAKEMDDVIATGNGTTQPEGIIHHSGTTGVTFGGVTSLDNYESLLFGVAKQYRKAPGNTFMFCGTETSYMRMRAIPVGTTDARRLFGMNHESYECFPPRRFAINEALTNSEIFSGDLKRYRLYERLGLSTTWSTEGRSLMRANTALLAVRFRFGGQIMVSEAFAVASDAPA